MKIVVWEAVRTEGHFVRFETNCPAWANGIFMHDASAWASRNFCFRTGLIMMSAFSTAPLLEKSWRYGIWWGQLGLECTPVDLKRDRWKFSCGGQNLQQDMVRIFSTQAPRSRNIPTFERLCAGTQIGSFYAASVLKSILGLGKAEPAAGTPDPRVGNRSYRKWKNAAWMEMLLSYSMEAGQIQCKCLPCWFTENQSAFIRWACLK